MNPDSLIQRYLLGEATEGEVGRLEALLAEDPALRRKLIFEANVDASLREIALERVSLPEVVTLPKTSRMGGLLPLSLAACLAFMLGLAFMHFQQSPDSEVPMANLDSAEPSAEGFAVLGNLFDAEWERNRRQGDSLGAEVIRLRKGIAEIQFFSGATMVLEGPAEIALKSAWEASCHEGVVRMRVPPAARGFKLHGPDTEIVDLGTEFGFEVRESKSHVEVLDGEISFKHRDGDEQLVKEGAAWELPGDGAAKEAEAGRVAFPMAGNIDLHQRQDFEQWQAHSRAFARDPRVVVYYTFERSDPTSVIQSLAEPRSSEFDGAVILAETAAGRWPGLKQALEFRRPGARVRVRIPGEFHALTFAAWVRIDSLDRTYNALFMGDGYETGEPHWQIREDGKLMLSVMVDDSRPHPAHPDVRYHHVYFSEPMWDMSMSGQWVHLASVFDPEKRQVSHYVDGKQLSQEAIKPEFMVETLRIGNGEIGNWGQPFRESPWFAIRNLNGRIDELAILNAALTDTEIAELHRRSRAQHH